MQETIAKESPRRRIARRIGAAGVALAAVVTLGACNGTGGGYVGTPLDGGPVGVFQTRADFGFNFTCEMNTTAKKAVIKGEITYHDSPSTIDAVPFPEIRLHGTVEPIEIFNVETCADAEAGLFDDYNPFPGVPAAQFAGTYRPQDATLRALPGKFSVLVGDQGEPGHPQGDFDGDLFSIELIDGAYNGYTRGGYIEGGNIQVD